MPRTTLDKPTTSYRRFNDWVRGELRRQKKSQTDLARYIGIDQCGISKRLSGSTSWGFMEALNAVEYLGGELTEIL